MGPAGLQLSIRFMAIVEAKRIQQALVKVCILGVSELERENSGCRYFIKI